MITTTSRMNVPSGNRARRSSETYAQASETTEGDVSLGPEEKGKLFMLDDLIVEGNAWPLMPDGEYVMQYLYHETVIAFRAPKVILHMKIVQSGEHNGKRLIRAYRVKELIGRPRKWGRFKLTRHQDLFITLAHLYDKRLRHDRFSLRALTKVLLRATTRTVTTDYRQRLSPEALRYSVVDELVAIEAGEL